MNRLERYEHITQTAKTVARNFTNSETATFHYFNPNGLYAQWKANADKVSAIVDAGKAPSGALLTVGHLSDMSEHCGIRQLQKLAMQKRVGSIALSVAIELTENEILRQEKWLDEQEQAA